MTKETTILDLGSEDGSHIHSVLLNSAVQPENVHIADVDASAVQRGHARYGYRPIVIDEAGRLPFPDKCFDIVFCSSVIEHVTVPKEQVWSNGDDFLRLATDRQTEFAAEIERIAKQYFVQTPYKWFPIESHTWLPFVGWLPRKVLIRVLPYTNRFWIKTTKPDWRLLNAEELAEMFSGSEIIQERFMGLTKSIIAIKKAC